MLKVVFLFLDMGIRLNKQILSVLLIWGQAAIHASANSVPSEYPLCVDGKSISDTVMTKYGPLRRLFDYFEEANKEKKDKAFDFSVIAGPHYSGDTKFGIGMVAAGLYHTDRNDTILPLPIFHSMAMSPQ